MNPYQSHSYGPLLLYFLTPWVFLTHDPIALSIMMVIFNCLGLFVVYQIGKRYFGLSVGLLAALFLAVNFWHVIFSRMIYQPSPLPVLVALIAWGVLSLRKKASRMWSFILPVLFAISLQIHFISLPIVITCGLLIILNRRIDLRWASLGILVGITVWLPAIWYDWHQNLATLHGFVSGVSRMEHVGIVERTADVGSQFLQISSGQGLQWQLGYAYQDFVKQTSPLYRVGGGLLFALTILGACLNGVLAGLVISVPVFLIFVPLPDIVPRYFYQISPILCLFWAMAIVKVAGRVRKFDKLTLTGMSMAVVTISLVTIFPYFSFILKYNYPQGFLSSFSDVPYSFTEKGMEYVRQLAKDKGVCSFTISSDPGKPKGLNLDWAQYYVWNETKYDSGPWCQERTTAHYLMYFGPTPKNKQAFRRFGPYVIYESK